MNKIRIFQFILLCLFLSACGGNTEKATNQKKNPSLSENNNTATEVQKNENDLDRMIFSEFALQVNAAVFPMFSQVLKDGSYSQYGDVLSSTQVFKEIIENSNGIRQEFTITVYSDKSELKKKKEKLTEVAYQHDQTSLKAHWVIGDAYYQFVYHGNEESTLPKETFVNVVELTTQKMEEYLKNPVRSPNVLLNVSHQKWPWGEDQREHVSSVEWIGWNVESLQVNTKKMFSHEEATQYAKRFFRHVEEHAGSYPFFDKEKWPDVDIELKFAMENDRQNPYLSLKQKNLETTGSNPTDIEESSSSLTANALQIASDGRIEGCECGFNSKVTGQMLLDKLGNPDMEDWWDGGYAMHYGNCIYFLSDPLTGTLNVIKKQLDLTASDLKKILGQPQSEDEYGFVYETGEYIFRIDLRDRGTFATLKHKNFGYQ